MVGLMGWASAEQGWRKGPWTPEEDKLLFDYVTLHGEGRWSSVSPSAGLNRSGKSCRLRWVNYLRPGLKRTQITPQEEAVIIELHALWGNKWSTIARYLSGRTDNEIKNYWRTHFKKKEKSGRKRKSQNIKQEKPTIQSPQEAENKILTMEEVPISNIEEMKQQELVFMCSENNLTAPTSSAWMDAMCHDQDSSSWGSLWNFGDQTPTVKSIANQMVALSMQQNQATNNNNNDNNNNGLSWGGDPNNLYNIEGYIF